MVDRRPSLIDQMALAALGEVELSSGDEESSYSEEGVNDEMDVMLDSQLVFNSNVMSAEMSAVDEEQGNMSSSETYMDTSHDDVQESEHLDPLLSGMGVDQEIGGGAATRRGSHSMARRPSINITVAGGASTSNEENTEEKITGTNTLLPLLGRMSTITTNRRQNTTLHPVRPSSLGDLDGAIESLATHTSNSEWQNIAAAATVVAAGTQGSNKKAKRHIKFAVGDTVLVLLTLLNVTNAEDPKDTFTVAPVNRLGYPQGEGRTDEEKVGPYTFVLAMVEHVHFDEDDRYYTVIRADTETEQRADSGWIEPLSDPAGIEAASRAAKLTVRSAQEKPEEVVEETGYLQNAKDFFLDIVSWPADFSRSTLLPLYRRQRSNAKQKVALLLYGDSPFACRVRVTGINFLVFCSITFLFLELINLAFLPADYDKQFVAIGVTVWSILVLELIFELIVRPKGYSELIQSDRAFAPSTARHINRFHMIFEIIALMTYIPEFNCIRSDICDRDSAFSRVSASLGVVIGESHAVSARSRFLLGLTALRLFGPIRHWKQMFINNTFRSKQQPEGIEKWLIPGTHEDRESARSLRQRDKSKKNDDDVDSHAMDADEYPSKITSSEEDQRLKNAATIGTALMVVNSQRALVLLTAIVLVLPLLQSLTPQNATSYRMVDLLQAHNLAAPTNSSEDCSYLAASVRSWLNVAAVPQPPSMLQNTEDTYVLWAQLLPVRCEWQMDDGIITSCDNQKFGESLEGAAYGACAIWDEYSPPLEEDSMRKYFARSLNLRFEGLRRIDRSVSTGELAGFASRVLYNDNPTVSLVNMGDFFVLLGILFVGLYGLNALRGEAIRLVLDPLQRMLKIVLRYAENPLSQDVNSGSKKEDDSALGAEAEEIGNYETEQLINAITKIADLLRKCWGVAGAGIISSNLARTKDGKTVVFNPTVPGKRVYALFGFVAINGFSEQLRALDRDVMILINDVAKVVHDEVYRWALGDHGQCNKNLGSSFLMVFRIGDFTTVKQKKMIATEKLFREYAKTSARKSTNLRKRYTSPRSSVARSPYSGRKGPKQDIEGELQLASLPGIQGFTDRALLGMLKSFAGVHRDKQLTVWKNDFRLSAGVSAYHVDIIYGMDAGWAVEGAVGSEYKIDATYLSPHVNMASRMMSAAKQYGVTILLSKKVEELLSRTCRKKLRHLDTVYVKGSKVKQDIFTYDARYRGVDFFLLERTPEQADLDAEAYSPSIWEHDRDLLAMRQHVSDEFVDMFHLGVKQYLAGRWKEAHSTLQRADDIMMETVLADGYLEYDTEELEGRILDRQDQSEDIVRVRHRLGDGACRVLMAYMERRKLKAPDNWDGVRTLASK